MNKALLVIAITCLSSCLSEEDLVQFTPEELTLLLASDSAKTWVLTDRSINSNQSMLAECEKDDYLIFARGIAAPDSQKLQFETGPMLCPGQSDSIIYQGYWQAIDSTSLHFLYWVVDGDTSIRAVDFITSELLHLSYLDGTDQISEGFVITID